MSATTEPGPRWRRVLGDLTGWLDAGEVRPGERLPSEAELAERFGVHRLTVRQALGELARTGAIRTVHGRGSYVAEPPYRFRVVPDAPSIVAQMREQGRSVTQRLVAHSVVPSTAAPDATGLPDGDLLQLDTVMCVDGAPWSRATTWLAHDRFAGIPAVWTDNTSLTGLLQAAYGLRMRRAWRRYAAEPAGPADADALDVALGVPLLVLVGANCDQDGEVTLVAARRTRGDRIEYVVEL
ncbi:GntR family transcriptional regulator [Pseudonocardia sichuanensis]